MYSCDTSHDVQDLSEQEEEEEESSAIVSCWEDWKENEREYNMEQWCVGQVVVDRKSVFQGLVTQVEDEREVDR